MNTHSKQLQEKLWAAAEQLRANGSLKLNEISEPILGLIFLKFADVRFKRVQKGISETRTASYGTRKRPVSPDDYKAKGVLFIPERATYSYLMSLSESENIGKTINEAMKAIEAENRELAGILPQDFTAISKKQDENSRILIPCLKISIKFRTILKAMLLERSTNISLVNLPGQKGQKAGSSLPHNLLLNC